MGCRLFQGYLFGKPMALEALKAQVAEVAEVAQASKPDEVSTLPSEAHAPAQAPSPAHV